MVGPRTRYPAWSRDILWRTVLQLLLLLPLQDSAASQVGCADGTQEGLGGHARLAACAGTWEGHVHNASTLCAPGWRVCSWYDHTLLRTITWKNATSFPGCFAYNAAQDGGRCRECRDDLEHDDVAGVGKDCAHQHRGQSSCIAGGRIDASCCVDAHFQRACAFQASLMTGVLCCRMPVKPPVIVVRPPERMNVYTGFIFLLNCQATGTPPPRTQWYKDGQQLSSNNLRTTALSSGDLLVTLARKSDTGLYTCEVINEEGVDMASSFVSVLEYTSGCADDSTEGLHLFRDIHACAGRWEGHVRNGKALCKRGWRACNPKDKDFLELLTWSDIYDLPGCYAYNGASRHGQCQKCKNDKMAGVGRNCMWMRHTRPSCLSRGRVDVLDPRNGTGCNYVDGVTSGVLCCRRKSKKTGKNSVCKPECENGGTCIGPNRCQCASGYKGARCQNAICEPDCGTKGICIKPNKCRCHHGYSGKLCRQKVNKCQQPCLNGGRCQRGKCKCPADYTGGSCQHATHHDLLSSLNRTER
ncbi:hemicentin-1-like [Pomacea canaliculata]|uniref:hemicentin-1-like n=1 Tax=Pomacea canaliculata TaxID=400727 RepID=UPI000D7344B6|nr:hemicentin-1-like [Pomacea canaliculata]XP_025093187.1 hemicentin-1-like [Pomacea canaliculata]XP_025093188.1 hemicentin-1-like [Pomacea canaliculata]XP_025093190.1 hemicentin-1-like [Pomacea canaliculata]XP_025093191.1 hemicentin-1-like [Pomacea canaliculata]